MQTNVAPQINFEGRSGLSRSLRARFTETHFINAFMAMTLFLGLLASMNVFLPLLKMQFKAVLNFSCFMQVFGFMMMAYISWVLRETEDLRVHLHGERIIYEIKEKGGVPFTFKEIESIRFGHSQGIFGFYVVLQNHSSFHFPIHLERIDYILDSIHFHRSDLTQTKEFMQFRNRALVTDHMLAHNRSYLSRANIKALSFYLFYPFYIRHSMKRIEANPRQVSRDMNYEKKMETLCHRMNIGVSLATLAIVMLMKFHS